MNKKSIIFFVIAVILAIVGFFATNTSKQTDAVLNAVYVADGKVVPENEGKIVIVPGKVEAATPLVDELTGVELPGVRAKRNVERYEKVSETKDDTVYYVLEWKSTVLGGDNAFNEMVSSNLIADCKVGEFSLENKMLTSITMGERFHDIDADLVYRQGYNVSTYNGITYMLKSDFMPYGGEDYTSSFKKNGLTTVYYRDYENLARINYTVQKEDDSEYTFIGIQKDGKLVYDKKLDMQPAFDGIHTAEQLSERIENGGKIGAFAAWGIAAFMIFLGIYTGKKKYVPTDEELAEMEKDM